MNTPQKPLKAWDGAANSAYVLMALTIGAACIPGIGFLAWAIAAPILLVCFVLSIVVMSKGGMGDGIGILLLTLILAPVLIIAAPIASTMVFGQSAALSPALNNRMHAMIPQLAPSLVPIPPEPAKIDDPATKAPPSPAASPAHSGRYVTSRGSDGTYHTTELAPGVSQQQSVGGGGNFYIEPTPTPTPSNKPGGWMFDHDRGNPLDQPAKHRRF